MRIALFVIVLLLSGCAQFVRTEKGPPEVIYASDENPPTKILRQTNVHWYRVSGTIEGTLLSAYRFDLHHSMLNPNQTTVDLPFLDSVDVAPKRGGGVISKIFSFNNNNAWIAFIDVFEVSQLSYATYSGWFSHNSWLRYETMKIHVKTFTIKSLINETVLEVCNPQDTANPMIQFDESIPAIRFSSADGTKLYLPMTDQIRAVDKTTRCSKNMEGRRRWKTFYERKSFGTP